MTSWWSMLRILAWIYGKMCYLAFVWKRISIMSRLGYEKWRQMLFHSFLCHYTLITLHLIHLPCTFYIFYLFTRYIFPSLFFYFRRLSSRCLSVICFLFPGIQHLYLTSSLLFTPHKFTRHFLPPIDNNNYSFNFCKNSSEGQIYGFSLLHLIMKMF